MPGPDGKARPLHVVKEKFELSVHAVAGVPSAIPTLPRFRQRRPAAALGCIQCHQDLWKSLEEDRKKDYERLGVVVEQIEQYLKSVHARPRRDDQSSTQCHLLQLPRRALRLPIGSTGRADCG